MRGSREDQAVARVHGELDRLTGSRRASRRKLDGQRVAAGLDVQAQLSGGFLRALERGGVGEPGQRDEAGPVGAALEQQSADAGLERRAGKVPRAERRQVAGALDVLEVDGGTDCPAGVS